MARKVEFIRKSEARILVYLATADRPERHGSAMCRTLNIDYAYLMKVLQQMWVKGWVGVNIYNGTRFFGRTLATPMKAAKYRLSL